MANTLMFEVGIKSAQEQLDKIKQEFTKANGELSKLLNIKVSIDGVDAVTRALSQIGDTSALRSLRSEIAALNREFSVLSKGAGGSGDIAGRGLAADIERTSQSIDRYTSKIKQLTEERTRLVGGTRNSSYQNYTDEILRYEESLEGARRKLAQLNEQKNQPVASEPLKKSTQDAQAFETALGRIETAIGGLKSGMSVNLTGEFSKWAQEVQNVTVSVRELVEQLQKMHNASTTALQATQQLSQAEQKGTPQGGLFDTQKFNTLQEAIDKIISEINRLQQAFAKLGENSSLSNLSTMINGLAVTLSTLSSAINLSPTSDYVKKLQTDFEAAQAKVQELTEKLTALAAVQNQVAETAAKAGKSEQQIGDSQKAMFNRYQKLLADIQNIEREALNLRNVLGGNNPFSDGLRNYIIDLGRIRDEVKSIASAPNVADAITKGMSSEKLSKLSAALANIKTQYKEVVSDAKDFNKATDKGSSQAEARIRKLGMAFNELKNYMRQNGGSEEMKRLQTEIQGAIRKMRDLMNAGNFAGAINVYERLSGIIRQAASATKEFENSQHSLSSTISHTNSNLQGQSQILSDLKSMATQYLSVWGAQSFINNIIELGGQLEQQRLSIGAILQDTAQANHLFSQIKDLAIKSPFGVQQLDAMTKQLSAYGFQYSELYDWTKRLADISAATGTSVDRLALALGHVRSEGALSGYTLRQFSMGNIPLLQKLSENLGKTKQEIRKMTRNKEIGYEDVLNVLKQLTDEGGMFFEAQETMSQALNAKFKNLRDSFQIMYSEMAEGAPGDFLKGLATTLTDLSRQWQILMPMVGAAGAMWAMNKASAALVNVELAKMATLTNANTLASSKYSVAQLRQIANWEKMPHAMVRARLALQGFKTSLLSLGKMVFSWPTAIFAAIEALTYMWAKQSRESEKAKEMTEVLTNTALESQKNLAKQLSNIDPYEEGMSDSAMKTGIESMTEAIKNYGVNAQAVLETVFGKDAEGRVMSLAEKYQYLRGELEKTEKVYKEMQRTSGGIEFGVEFTDGGWLDDDVQSDLTNYAEAVKEYEDAFVSMTANYATAVNNALEQVKKASPEFKRIADGLSSDAERVKWLYENQGEYGGIYNMFKGALHREDPNAGGGVLGTQLGDNLRSAKQEAMKELDQFLKGTEEWFKKFGYDFTENGKNLSEVQVGNLLRQSKEWLEKHPEWQNIYDVIWDKLNKRWGLPIVPDVTEIEEELPQWLVDFQKELDKTGIKLTAKMSMEQIVDEMKKAYDKAQTTINKLGPIAMQAKIDIKGLTDEYIENYKFLNPELYETLKELKKAQDSQSQVTTAAEKRGLQLKGMKKDGTHKAEKQNQEAAKAVREQVRVIKEAADAFQYWREKVGDKGAWEHVQQEFGDVLAKIGITATNIEDVRGQLKKIPQMKEYKAITDKKVKTEIDKEISKDNDQFIRKDFERDTERFLSKTQIELDNLTRSWETFNSVREATGDVQLAIELSGAEYANGKTQNLADAIREKIQKDFASVGAIPIPFDINMHDEQIGDAIKAAMPKASEDQIKGFVEEYKKWRDLQRQVRDEAIKAYASMVADTDSLKSKVAKVNDEYVKQIEHLQTLKRLGSINNEQYNNGVERAERTRKLGYAEALVNTTDWSKSFGIVGSILKTQAQQLGEELKKIINGKDFGKLDAAEQQKYLALQRKLYDGGNTATSPFNLGAWGKMQDLSQKFQGYVKKLVEAMKDLEYWTNEVADAEKDYNNAKTMPEKMTALARLTVARQNQTAAQGRVSESQTGAAQTGEELEEAGDNAVKGLNNFSTALGEVTAGSLSSLVLGIGNIIKVIKGDGELANSVGELFGKAGEKVGGLVGAILQIIDMLGEEPAKFIDDLLTKISKVVEAVISQIPQILGSVVKGVGNIVGSAIDGVGSLFGIDLGISDLFNPDGKLQKQIEALEANNKALQANTSAILSARERTLGYDTDAIRKRMRDLYQGGEKRETSKWLIGNDWYKEGYNSSSQKAMYDFYNEGGLNGYSQQLENIKKQRENLLAMYNAEHAKKDKSQEALEDYKQQIAELDDQIMFFAEDLSEELFGLDLKGWADQIGDSLMNAFENGEDAAEAFNDTVQDIMRQVLRKMLNLGVVEPMMERLQKKLFGENGQGGSFDPTNPGGTIDAAMRDIAEFFGEGGDGQKMIEASETFYKRWQSFMESQGLTLESGESSSSTVGGGIKSITEQTADLLASYLNACRADLSVNRAMIAQYFPLYYDAMTSGNENLRNIENHTAAIMRSNDAIMISVENMYSLFNGLKNKAWKIPMA